MTPVTEIRQQAIALLDRLSPEKLTAILQLLEVLAEPLQPKMATEETTLLQTIQHGLSSGEQRRLEELRNRCEWGELSEAEHQELIDYEDLLEQQRVERLEALMQLAKLRNINLTTLNEQLKSEAHSSNAA